MGVAGLALVADGAEHVDLAAFGVDGIAHRLAVDGEPFVGRGLLGVPALYTQQIPDFGFSIPDDLEIFRQQRA